MMTTDESYNGWTNRETWAVALWINNDQGMQGEVYGRIREFRHGIDAFMNDRHAGQEIREYVTELLDSLEDPETRTRELVIMARDIGSLWRVSWHELGASFLRDVTEQEDQS